MVTIQDAKDYLGIDFEDEATNRRLEHLLTVADAYLRGSLGENYPEEDGRVRELALIVIADLFDNRGLIEKASGNVRQNVRRMVEDFSLQIRLEMRAKDDLPLSGSSPTAE